MTTSANLTRASSGSEKRATAYSRLGACDSQVQCRHLVDSNDSQLERQVLRRRCIVEHLHRPIDPLNTHIRLTSIRRPKSRTFLR